MINSLKIFPFGAPVRHVMQLPDGLRKRAFVLGIYSSAVHARWIEPAGIVKVAALAVASEPYIFGEGKMQRNIFRQSTSDLADWKPQVLPIMDLPVEH